MPLRRLVVAIVVINKPVYTGAGFDIDTPGVQALQCQRDDKAYDSFLSGRPSRFYKIIIVIRT